jgi:protein gp37
MSNYSKIEWTETTWNPVTGCTKISKGCLNCYAERMAKRLGGRYGYPNDNPFQITLHPNRLFEPYKLKKQHIIFVCSMSDLFHEKVPDSYIFEILNVVKKCPQHTFQILTKRAERMLQFSLKAGSLPDNLWFGVTVEAEEYKIRIDLLRRTGTIVKFLSCEPLLNDLGKINLHKIDWVIVGGESGFNARAIKAEWVINIRDQCLNNNIPFFFKQWGGINKKKSGRYLEGKEWNQMPELKFEKKIISSQMQLAF